jgi:hypothetical protein
VGTPPACSLPEAGKYFPHRQEILPPVKDNFRFRRGSFACGLDYISVLESFHFVQEYYQQIQEYYQQIQESSLLARESFLPLQERLLLPLLECYPFGREIFLLEQENYLLIPESFLSG